MNSIQTLFPNLTEAQLFAHTSILAINLVLFLLIKPILTSVESGKDHDSKIYILRAINIFIIILLGINLVLSRAHEDYQNHFIKIGLSLFAIYAGFVVYSISSYFLRKRFGTEKELDNKQVFLETYSSRIVDILLMVLVIFATLYAIIMIWGADSMLETTGIIGIVFAFMAFTSSIWAPDIISGLIILNTQMLEDGDLVLIDGYPDEYIISKVSFIYVILYDARNNHRTLIRNSRFIQSKIDNLSRIASTDGIRKRLVYQIGYPDISAEDAETRYEQFQLFKQNIDKMFDKAYHKACEDEKIKINSNKHFEWSLTKTGNYALEYTLWFYLEKIPNTKVTATIRKHYMRTIYRVNEAVFDASITENIDLSTPDLNTITVEKNSAK